MPCSSDPNPHRPRHPQPQPQPSAQDEDLHRSAVDIYTRLLDAPTTKMPDVLLQARAVLSVRSRVVHATAWLCGGALAVPPRPCLDSQQGLPLPDLLASAGHCVGAGRVRLPCSSQRRAARHDTPAGVEWGAGPRGM